MCGQLVAYLNDHQADIAVSEVAAKNAADVVAQYALIEKARGGTARRTATLTGDAKAARQTLLDLLPALLGPLRSVATRLGDNDLLALATLTSKQLRKLRPLAFIGVAESILNSAARPDVVPELAKQGLTAAALKPLHDALKTYKTAQPATRQTINERVLAGAALEDLLTALLVEVRQLDEDMKAFKLLNRALFDGYQQARKLVSSGGGGSKGGGVQPKQ
ncbi:hypothetical protein GCM10028821_07110 [Hymenobacter jeollabukensis]